MQTSISLKKWEVLSGSMLKLLAVLSMLIDHTAVTLSSQLTWMEMPIFTMGQTEITLYRMMRVLGRFAFPIFCFLASEGARHTSHGKRYCFRLLLFAFVSEIPFNMMMNGSVIYPIKQNVYFTLFLGVLLIYIFEKVSSKWKKALLMLAVIVLSACLQADYGPGGVLLILLIYVLRNHAVVQAVLAFPLLIAESPAILAFIPINMYNGKRGFIRSGWLKYGFYAFYPLHILLLCLIQGLL